jgi:outer membrane protein assembly factor BamB
MRKIHIRACVTTLLIFFVFTLWARQRGEGSGGASTPANSSTNNPRDPNYVRRPTQTFKVGNQPRGVAFDGTNIWVANSGDDTVTELRASDGTVVGNFNVGSAPDGVVFDGANIWVVNEGNNFRVAGSVTKLRASDGGLLGTFKVGRRPSTAMSPNSGQVMARW